VGYKAGATALRWRPEWPITLVVTSAWFLLAWSLVLPGEGRGWEGALKHDGRTAAAHDRLEMPGGAVTAYATQIAAALPAWALMSVAMMLPIALPALRFTAFNSILSRRQRAMTLFVAAYLVVWLGFGAVALGAHTVVRTTLAPDPGLSLATTLIIAGAWQLTRTKRRALNMCRRTLPLPPTGRKADRASVQFGLMHGARCAKSCWALMLVMIVIEHPSPLLMIALTALISAEELTVIGRRLSRPTAALFAFTGTAILLGA
jgi:predicted metal-binding membrane protein